MDIRQKSNRKKYDLTASIYNFVALLLSLGQIKRIYRETASLVPETPEQDIIEIGCGPGSVIPSILKKCHSSSHILGIDFSEKMIELAKINQEENQWQNVVFLCKDIHEFNPESQADTVIFCLSLTAIPDMKKTLIKGLELLKSEGRLIIVDSIPLHSKWYHPLANCYTYLKSMVVGAKPSNEILSFLQSNATILKQKELLGGIYTILEVQKN